MESDALPYAAPCWQRAHRCHGPRITDPACSSDPHVLAAIRRKPYCARECAQMSGAARPESRPSCAHVSSSTCGAVGSKRNACFRFGPPEPGSDLSQVECRRRCPGCKSILLLAARRDVLRTSNTRPTCCMATRRPLLRVSACREPTVSCTSPVTTRNCQRRLLDCSKRLASSTHRPLPYNRPRSDRAKNAGPDLCRPRFTRNTVRRSVRINT